MQVIKLFVFFGSGWEHVFDDAESVGGPIPQKSHVEKWLMLKRNSQSSPTNCQPAASRSTADVGQKIAYPWSNAFVVHGSLGIKPLKHQGSLVWVGKISIGKRSVFMILGWSFGHDWYDWHDGVGTAKFFWRWNNTHILWYRYICIYLLVGFELMVESRFIWPTFWLFRSPASPRRSNVNQQSVHWFQRITPRNSGFGVLVYQRLRKCGLGGIFS